MARARLLKPRFFTDEDLLELPPLIRLLFAGLWTVADREGRLEDRPRRLKIELFPCNAININDGLDKLAAKGLIVRYEVGECRFISIPGFQRHQSPHIKEPPSTIPAPCENGASPSESLTGVLNRSPLTLTGNSAQPKRRIKRQSFGPGSGLEEIDHLIANEEYLADLIAELTQAFPRASPSRPQIMFELRTCRNWVAKNGTGNPKNTVRNFLKSYFEKLEANGAKHRGNNTGNGDITDKWERYARGEIN